MEPPHRRRKAQAVERMARFFEVMEEVEPGQGHAAAAKRWQEEHDRLKQELGIR